MYLDPGSWGLLLQVIIGGIISVPFLVVTLSERARRFILRRKPADDD
jgi:uncharacterized membrane protein (DUF4010 family)